MTNDEDDLIIFLLKQE